MRNSEASSCDTETVWARKSPCTTICLLPPESRKERSIRATTPTLYRSCPSGSMTSESFCVTRKTRLPFSSAYFKAFTEERRAISKVVVTPGNTTSPAQGDGRVCLGHYLLHFSPVCEISRPAVVFPSVLGTAPALCAAGARLRFTDRRPELTEVRASRRR